MSARLSAVMKKNYAGRKYAPGLVLIWHHAGVCCAGVVGAVRWVAIHAGILCVSVDWRSLCWCLSCRRLSCRRLSCMGAVCGGACHALRWRSGVAFIVLVSVVGAGLSRRCGVCPIGIRRVLRWTLCPEKRNMSID